MRAFWDTDPYSLIEVDWHFRVLAASFITLKMEAVSTSEISACFYKGLTVNLKSHYLGNKFENVN
jgi:hypothetical protein